MPWRLCYRALWKSLKDSASNSLYFRIPETIIFCRRTPVEGYYFDENSLCRYSDDLLNTTNIFRSLVQNSDSPIVANIIWYDQSITIGSKLRVKYLVEDELSLYLFDRNFVVPNEWVLQAFVPPPPSTRVCTHVSERIGAGTFTVSTVSNRYIFLKARAMETSCVTVESVNPNHVHHIHTNIRLRDLILDSSEQILESLSYYFGEPGMLDKEMFQFYFKCDKFGTLYFLWEYWEPSGRIHGNDKFAINDRQENIGNDDKFSWFYDSFTAGSRPASTVHPGKCKSSLNASFNCGVSNFLQVRCWKWEPVIRLRMVITSSPWIPINVPLHLGRGSAAPLTHQ